MYAHMGVSAPSLHVHRESTDSLSVSIPQDTTRHVMYMLGMKELLPYVNSYELDYCTLFLLISKQLAIQLRNILPFILYEKPKHAGNKLGRGNKTLHIHVHIDAT